MAVLPTLVVILLALHLAVVLPASLLLAEVPVVAYPVAERPEALQPSLVALEEVLPLMWPGRLH